MNTRGKQTWFAICYLFTRPLSRLTAASQVKSEDEHALQFRRPSDQQRPEYVDAARRAAPEISRVGVTFLATAHISGAFGTLAAISQAQGLANLPSIRFALVSFIVGIVCVGADLLLVWQHNLHHQALHDLSQRPWSARARLWAEIDVLLLRLRTWAVCLSAALFIVGACLLTVAVFP